MALLNDMGYTAREMEYLAPIRREESNLPTWLVILAVMVVFTVAYFFMAKIVDDQAHASYNAHKELCDQYMNDTSLDETAAQETINQICL